MAITGVLLAFLASHQKRLQMESALVARILSRLRSETTLDAALETTGHELLRELRRPCRGDCRASKRAAARRCCGRSTTATKRCSVRCSRRRKPTITSPKAPAAFVLKRRRTEDVITAVRKGSVGAMATTLAPAQAFRTALVATASYEETGSGVCSSTIRPAHQQRRRPRAARAGDRFHGTGAPLRLPDQAAAIALRGVGTRRLARELHDTSVQSLIGLEMEVMALSRRTTDAIAAWRDRCRALAAAAGNRFAPQSDGRI